MKDKITLKNSIMIDNKAVSELSYDTEEITNDLFLKACARSTMAGNDMNASVAAEFNTALHFNLGKAAIVAVNPGIDWEELARVKGYDLMKICAVGRFFIRGTSADGSTESGLES